MHYKKLYVKGRRVDEHVYVWEQHFGSVPKGYVVHHKDEDKGNNDISNLELMTLSEHSRSHRLGTRLSEVSKNKVKQSVIERWRKIHAEIPEGYSVCCACNKILPLSAFNKDKYTRSGVYSKCKACRKAYRSN